MALTSFIPSLWSAAALEAFRPAEVVAQLTNREYEGIATSGNVVKVNSLTIGDGTPVQDYKAGVIPPGGTVAVPRTHSVDDVNSASQDVLIDQEKAIAFQVGDIDRVQAAGSFEPVTRDAAKLLSEDAESFIISAMKTGGTAAGTTALPADDTAGDAAFDKVGELRRLMTKANVPNSGRYLVVNPEFLEILLKASSKLTNVDMSGETSGLRDAVIGRLSSFNVVESNMLTNSNKPAAIALHTSAVAYVNQIEEVEGFRSHASFADVIRMLHVYGVKVLRPTAVQVYLSA